MIFIGPASSCDSLGGTWWAARYGAWIEVSKLKQYIKLGEQIKNFKTIKTGSIQFKLEETPPTEIDN